VFSISPLTIPIANESIHDWSKSNKFFFHQLLM
jgi:hypothetical protein